MHICCPQLVSSLPAENLQASRGGLGGGSGGPILPTLGIIDPLRLKAEASEGAGDGTIDLRVIPVAAPLDMSSSNKFGKLAVLVKASSC